MPLDTLIQFTTQGMLLCLTVSLPVVIVAGLVGLGVSFLQAITSMQDQSISHAIKLIAVTITIVIVAPLSWINRVRAFQPTDDPARPDQLPALSLALGAPGLPLHSAQR